MNANCHSLHFYVNQTLGSTFIVDDEDLVVIHLGVFDMNPDNEPTLFRGLCGGGANFLINVPAPVQKSTWGEIKILFR